MVNVWKRYENCSFDNFQGKINLESLKNADKLDHNIIITGGVGTGKTHLAFAILNKFEKKIEINSRRYYSDEIVEYTNIKQIIDAIKRMWDDSSASPTVIEKFKNVPVLIIDEVGVQYGSESERIELFELFNERYNNMLPTIAISNLAKDKIEKILGLRICDRLFGGAEVIELNGNSRR